MNTLRPLRNAILAANVSLVTFLFLEFSPAFGCAQLAERTDRWKQAAAGVEFVDKELWNFPCAPSKPGYTVPKARLTAFRFDRKQFEFILLDPRAELNKIDRKRYDLGGVFLNKSKQFMQLGQN